MNPTDLYRRAIDGAIIATGYADQLLNPFKLDVAEGALADDMRTKLLYDFAYSVRLEDFRTFLETDLSIILRTPLVMILGKGR